MRALPAHAILVNVGRGATLGVEALIRVLNEGHLGGAGLDVVEAQCKHANHPLWKTPRLLLTPHVAAHEPARPDALERFFEEQLRRYLTQEPLENLVPLSEITEHAQTSEEFGVRSSECGIRNSEFGMECF